MIGKQFDFTAHMMAWDGTNGGRAAFWKFCRNPLCTSDLAKPILCSRLSRTAWHETCSRKGTDESTGSAWGNVKVWSMPPNSTTPWFHQMDAQGETPLSRAEKCGFLPLAELLLAHEGEYTVGKGGASSELHRAAYWGLSGAVGQLLAKGADPSERDQRGNTPLLQAVRNGCREAVEAFLMHGADVNVRDSLGLTCLHWVALNGRPDIAELLLDAGIDLNPPAADDHQWPSPTGMALLMGYQELVETIGARGGAF